ncbi:GNAT family N-acetyltransferase [Pseudomonas mosselii]|uniref:GNAT family N-acetyltransferase n=1 Tax=Pseudomonas mosselii TaxID=78327 RepID=UPI000D8DA3AE|nr:GNAT family N-acetyltransferase [Pseudomonas mosselii]PYC16944.1 hypothetical protein DMX06_19280 [Pseudomonas mosselii]
MAEESPIVPINQIGRFSIKRLGELLALTHNKETILTARIESIDDVFGGSVLWLDSPTRDEALVALVHLLATLASDDHIFLQSDYLCNDLADSALQVKAIGHASFRCLFSKADVLQPHPRNHHPATDSVSARLDRPAKPRGELYYRSTPILQEALSFRSLCIDSDLELFNKWQNDPRVSHHWQEKGDLDHHHKYLSQIDDDPHIYSMIACFEREPFAYLEAYWAKEDRIAPFCDAQDHDRGFHLLVGEKRFLGRQRTDMLLSSIVHYLFLDDARTHRVVVEPRSDNAKMIALLQRHGFVLEKYFNFPHKEAALMTITREAFFNQNDLYNAHPMLSIGVKSEMNSR